tara:strand:+ start:253 stop:501 length:249 start_codon:yes stop_codon:yes gene_type:complete
LWKNYNYQRLFNIEFVEKMWKKQMMLDMVISMMTEKDFWDKFNAKHNPGYHYAKKKNQKKEQKKNKKQKDYSFKFKIFRKSD